MKQKLITAILCLTMTFSCAACNMSAQSTSGNSDDLQSRIEELEKENAKLKAGNENVPKEDSSTNTESGLAPTGGTEGKNQGNADQGPAEATNANEEDEVTIAKEEDFEVQYDAALEGLIIQKYKGHGNAIIIPAQIGGDQVKVIGQEAFQKKSLDYVEIPEGVTEIRNALCLKKAARDIGVFRRDRFDCISAVKIGALSDSERGQRNW